MQFQFLGEKEKLSRDRDNLLSARESYKRKLHNNKEEGFREKGFKNPEIPEGWGGHHKPSGTEIPRGWGVKIKKPSVGGMDIFWNCTFHYKKILSTLFWPLFSCKSVEIHPALSVHQNMARVNDVNNTESQ